MKYLIEKNKILLYSMLFYTLIYWGFLTLFLNKFNFYPLHYLVDSYVFHKIFDSILNLNIPIPETVAMSPVYSILLLPFSIFTTSAFVLFIGNFVFSIIFLIYFYRLCELIIGSKGAFYSLLFVICNPYFLYIVLSGYSEIAGFMFIAGSFYYALRNKGILSGIFLPFGILIRLEFLLFFIFNFLFIKKGERIRLGFSIFLSLALILLVTGIFSYNETNPFLNKVYMIFLGLDYFVADNFSADMVNILTYTAGELYNPELVFTAEDNLRKLLNGKSFIEQLYSFPVNYFKYFLYNLYRWVTVHWIFLPLIFYYFFYKFKISKKNLFLLFIFITPFCFIATVLTNYFERYVIFYVFIYSFMFGDIWANLNLKTLPVYKRINIVVLICTICLFYTLYSNLAFFSQFDYIPEGVQTIKNLNIKNSNILTAEPWITYLSGNDYTITPPFAEEPEKYKQYLKEMEVDYIIIDNGVYPTETESVYNPHLFEFLEHQNLIELMYSNPDFYKVNVN
ncbi:MAG: hypothetical protein ACQESP_02445 [Candidatus Muiribacteriota bacterium]